MKLRQFEHLVYYSRQKKNKWVELDISRANKLAK